MNDKNMQLVFCNVFFTSKINKLINNCMKLIITFILIFFYSVGYGRDIVKNNFTFSVSDYFYIMEPEMVELILNSESIDNTKKQFWFDTLPNQTNETVERLRETLHKSTQLQLKPATWLIKYKA
jgi:hypothetical protein